MRPRHAFHLLLGCLLAGGAVCARAEDPGEAPLEIRVYDVRALVAGAPSFFPEAVGVHPSEVDETDGSHPSQAGESEMWLGGPGGTVDELIELLKAHVPAADWESDLADGPDVRSSTGVRVLVRQTAQAHDAIARWLAQMERDQLRSVEVEVAVVPLAAADEPPGDPLAIETLLAALPGRLTASVVTFPGHSAATFRGRRTAYLEAPALVGSETTPALSSRDGVVIDGLATRIEALPSVGDDSIRVRVHVTVGMRADGGEAAAERPALREQSMSASLSLEPGRWTWVNGRSTHDAAADGWSLAVRARRGAEAPAATARALTLPRFDTAHRGPLESARITMGGLSQAPHGYAIWGTPEIEPQGVLPAEPCELCSYSEPLPFEAFQELLYAVSAPAPWPPTWKLHEESGLLHVLAPRPATEALRAWLAALERDFVRDVALEVRVVDLPAAADLPRAGPWTEAAEGVLARALEDGSARVLERARLTSVGSLPHGVSSGTTRSFTRGYERVVRGDHATLRPDIRPAFEGLALDVTPVPWSSADRMSATLRLLLTTLESPVRTLETAAGPVELPASRTLRLRTTCDLALGSTTVMGALEADGRVALVLLTARTR
jgi:hypothetical protein